MVKAVMSIPCFNAFPSIESTNKYKITHHDEGVEAPSLQGNGKVFADF